MKRERIKKKKLRENVKENQTTFLRVFFLLNKSEEIETKET